MVPTIVIFLLGVGVSLQLWQTLQRQQDAELESNAAAVASVLARVIQAQIDDQELNSLRRWAGSSEALARDGSAAWPAKAEAFLSEHPSFSALMRIDRRGRASDDVGAVEARKALRSLRLASTSAETVSGPIRFPDGRAAFGVAVLPNPGAKEPTAVFALLEPTVALRRLLARGAPGYSIRVLCRREELFPGLADQVQPRPDRFWQAAEVPLSVSPPWTVAVHPTAMLVDAGRHQAAFVALVGGLTISGLLAALVHISQVARSRGASLVLVGADLRESMDETEREETEIRELRGALETRVTQRTATLQETIDELETFNYSVSHDLRSPIGAVINFAAILDHDYGHLLDESAKDYLSRISASAKVAVSLMDGLLAFSHSGREEIHKVHVDMRDLVEGVRDDLSAADATAGVAIQIGEVPDAYADPAMMRRVFTNLISNALKFSPKGEPLSIEVAGYAQAGEMVYFVRDQGVGFDMRYAQKLFGVFERLHSRDEFDGHGIGLAIVSRLVRRHGGRIWAQGAVGKGATFLFSLPEPGSHNVGADGPP
jgi:signal transduction histidine kinase